MKSLLLLTFAFIVSTGLFAQASSSDKKQDMKDLNKDFHDLKNDKQERAADVRNGDRQGAKDATMDIKQDNKDIRHDTKDLKADGVKHPIHRIMRHSHHRHH